MSTHNQVGLLVNALVKAKLLLSDSLEGLQVELELEKPNQLGLGVAHSQQLYTHSLVLSQVRPISLRSQRVLLGVS